MIAKKTRKADLERKRFAFFQIGLILAGSICLAAFEFVTPVFSSVEKQELEKNDVYMIPEIPKTLVASKTVQTRTTRPIHNEVKVVIDIPKNNGKSKYLPKNVNIDLNQLLNAFGGEEGGTLTQTVEFRTDTPDIYPEFKGNLGSWISKNIKLPSGYYPVSGTIYVSFVVSKTGEIADVKIAKSLDPEHDKAALDVVKKMPKWKPGEQFGKPVAVNYHLPIKIVNH